VHGVSTAAGTTPFDVILGESINRGWTATVAGGPSLGRPVLIDAFANGWRVDPVALAPYVHDGTLDVSLVWSPQTTANWAVLVSALAIVVCLVLAVWPVRRRRRTHARGRSGAAGHGDASEAARDGAADDADDALVLGRRPYLQVPFGAEGPRATVVVSVVTAASAGAVAAAIATPRTGLAVGVATLVVLLVPRLRFVLAIAAVACVVAAATYVVVHQQQVHVLDNGAWPQSFGTASRWAWAGVVFLGADGAVDVALRARSRRHQRTADDPDGGGPGDAGGDGSGPDDGSDGPATTPTDLPAVV